MAAMGVEEDPAVQAARILLTLRNRRLRRWPEWVPKEPAAVEREVCLSLERWPKRQRNSNRLRRNFGAAMAPPDLAASGSAPVGPGACSNGEERERSPAPPRWRERSTVRPTRDELMTPAPDSPVYYSAPAGTGPSTSADCKARLRHAVQMAAKASSAPVAAPPKEPMKASSPETPLDFGAAAAGSVASSSGDDVARPPSKRRAPEALGSGGGASSGDEGCSSPDKRARFDAGDGEKAISEPKTQTPTDCDMGVKFEFDLNMPWPEDGECPDFC